MAVRYLFITGLLLCLAGCIQVYGPVKTGTQQDGSSNSTGATETVEAGTAMSMLIGNRHQDELYDATLRYFHEKGMLPLAADPQTGVIATTGNDPELSLLYLDCSALKQTQNIQQQYRIAALIWSAGEGSRVSIMVNGIAGLTTADGNDKIKPVECLSTGVFEKDLLARLRQ